MNAPVQTQARAAPAPFSGAAVRGVLQRKCACGGTPGPTGECAECRRKRTLGLQTKLKVNEPGDRYEQEADRVADQVMRMPAPPVQRAEPLVQRRATAPGGPATAPPIVHEVLNSPGQPLDAGARSFIEPRLGHNFSHVRVHADAKAAASARAVQARAYTVGHDVVFADGQYAPSTEQGRRVLAHELTHVVQQGLEPPVALQRQAVDVELEAPTPEEAERLREQGIELPTVSATSADPRNHRDYVDRRVTAVGYGIYLGGYHLYVEGLEVPVMVPESYVDFNLANAETVNLSIYPSLSAATDAIPYGPPAPDTALPYAYYRAAAGALVVPTVFSPATSPRTIEAMREARRQLAQQVQEELTALAVGIASGLLLRGLFSVIARIRGRALSPETPPSGQQGTSGLSSAARRTLEGLSGRDREIMQEAMERAASRNGSFMDDLGALAETVAERIPAGQVHQLGRLEGGASVFGSLVTGTGIATINGRTVVVIMRNRQLVRIAGPFR